MRRNFKFGGYRRVTLNGYILYKFMHILKSLIDHLVIVDERGR